MDHVVTYSGLSKHDTFWRKKIRIKERRRRKRGAE